MTTDFEYALMAGASYISNRASINQFPVPQGWTATKHDDPPDARGFEAISFFNGASIETSTEIVISFAGTDYTSIQDWIANGELGGGLGSEQLQLAAQYYLQIKAANPSATITFTGH